jgi:hypothetical protein
LKRGRTLVEVPETAVAPARRTGPTEFREFPLVDNAILGVIGPETVGGHL